MSFRDRNIEVVEERECEKSVRSNGSLTNTTQFTIDENLLVDPKLLFIGSKIGEGAHGKVYQGRSNCCYQSSAAWDYVRRKSFA
uniref:Uncharacterized protein n=1 Tax=Medicago truncatula TaxID=3880 RepID=I3T9W3_MEDTR|nr:unknown [Medicago truncatula]